MGSNSKFRVASHGLLAAIFIAGCGTAGPGDVGGGSLHKGYITRSETWKAQDNPHIVEENVVVAGTGTPVLTIEAGVELRFAANTSLRIATHDEPGALKVLGTQDKPVKFVANDPTKPSGYYVGLILDTGTTNATTVSWLEFESCGADNSGGWNEACLVLTGENNRPKIEHVTVRGSSAYGISVEGLASFGAGSTSLNVKNSAMAGLYVQYPENIGSIPQGSVFESNSPNAIVIGNQAEDIENSQTWSDFGVPYVVEGEINVGATGAPVLTIAAGVELRFGPSGSLNIGRYEDAPAVLKVQGTAENKVVFTANVDEPSAGLWGGILMGDHATAASKVDQAVIEYGGLGGFHSFDPNAAVVVSGDKGPFLTNTTIRHSSSCGVLRVDYGDGFTTDFTAGHGNVFESNAGGDQCDWD